MKRTIFWDITSCNPLKISRRFGETRRLHPQGRRITQARHQLEAVIPSFNLLLRFQRNIHRCENLKSFMSLRSRSMNFTDPGRTESFPTSVYSLSNDKPQPGYSKPHVTYKHKYSVFWHYPSSCFYLKTQRFGDWILSPSSGKTYSVGSNR
jgi:hypothetical protein